MTFAIASKAGFALMLTLGAAQAQTTTTPPAAPAAPPAATTPMTPGSTAPGITTPDAAPVTPAAPSTAPGGTMPATTPGANVTGGAATDCAAEFTRLDTNNDGFLTEAEAPDVNARARIDEVTLQEKGVAREDYMRICDAPGGWSRPVAEEGAPFEGANSFTEGQAMDRAVAAGVIDVSALEKDDKGIWRGQGTLDGSKVSVAIDYKGNVVTTAAN